VRSITAAVPGGIHTTDFDKLLKHRAGLTDRFGNSERGCGAGSGGALERLR
jgi:hypothetical protein